MVSSSFNSESTQSFGMIFSTNIVQWTFITVTLLILVLAKRYYFNGASYNKRPDLRDKIAIVSGANSGIALYTSLGLAECGATVVMACETIEKAEAACRSIRNVMKKRKMKLLYKNQLIPMVLDLSSYRSIKRFAHQFGCKLVKLDILVLNTAIMKNSKETTEDKNDYQMQTNHLGHFYLTGLLLNRMTLDNEESISKDPSRIVLISSRAYAAANLKFVDDFNFEKTGGSYPGFEAYSFSMLCNILFAKQLHLKYRTRGILASCCHTGFVYSSTFGRSLSAENSGSFFMRCMLTLIEPLIWYASKPIQNGAATPLMLAVDKGEKVLEGGGKYFVENVETTTVEFTQNMALAEQVWDISERLIPKVKWP